MPHGLYPFSGACASIASMREVFPRMRVAAASVAFRVPVIRQLMGWINALPADAAAIRRALQEGDSICLFPGGVAEMVRTDGHRENLLLRSRKGVVRLAMENKVPLVPVYVFGQSVLWSQLPLPRVVASWSTSVGALVGMFDVIVRGAKERLSRWLQASIMLPYGRFGLLVPHKRLGPHRPAKRCRAEEAAAIRHWQPDPAWREPQRHARRGHSGGAEVV